MMGVGVGAVSSMKWVGFFVTALVGLVSVFFFFLFYALFFLPRRIFANTTLFSLYVLVHG